MILPAISIKEPWASMIAHGKKTIEVRTWQTSHRGKIIICASASPASEISGHAFALAEIIDIRPMAPGDAKHTGGHFDPAAFSWIFGNVRTFKKFPIKGKLGIFKIDTTMRQSV